MQRALKEDNLVKATHFGGIFAPLAQYPGASYAKLLAEKIEQDVPVVKNKKVQEKTIVRSTMPRNMKKHVLPFKTALLIVETESNANLDRAALRDAGISQVRVITSGVQAAKILSTKSDEQVDIVFCHPRFEDMSAVQWIELIRSHPALKNLPVLSLVGSPAEEKLLHAVLGGFTDSLTRPYSPKGLQEKLVNISHLYVKEPLANLPSAMFDATLLRFESRNTEDGKAGFNMEEGLRFMTNQQWDNAIQSFNKAILYADYKGDAELGLAAAWRGKQDMEKFRYYLYEASLTFTRIANWTKARSAYKHVLRSMPKAPSPFVRTMQNQIRSGNYEDAASTLAAGLELSGHENIASRIARACLYTENPPYTLQKVKQFFVDPSLKDIVKKLDIHLQQAFVTHQDNVNKAREEKLKLEKKAREHLQTESYANAVVKPLDADYDAKSNFNAGANVTGLKASSAKATLAKTVTPANAVVKPVDYDLPEYNHRGIADDYADDESILEDIPGNPSLMHDDYVKRNAREGVIPLMDENALESQIFSSFPGLNEAATVIKTTWKLMKK